MTRAPRQPVALAANPTVATVIYRYLIGRVNSTFASVTVLPVAIVPTPRVQPVNVVPVLPVYFTTRFVPPIARAMYPDDANTDVSAPLSGPCGSAASFDPAATVVDTARTPAKP